MIRKKKSYKRPKKAFEKSRIAEENALLEKYALKNKIEIWKSIAKVDYFRHRAKALAKLPLEEQQVLFNKLRNLGLNTNTISDVLALKTEDILERRLPTVLFKKGLAKTPQQARQLVVHKKILIDGKIIDVPSYLISIDEENKISIKIKKPKTQETAKEEVKEKEAEVKQ